jgi:hypothetical protein
VANDRVYAVDSDLFSRPGPRIVDALEELARLNKQAARMGGDFELSKLAQENPAFAPENLAKLVNDHRRQAIFTALVQRVRQAGASALATFDGGWRYRASLLDELVANKLVTEPMLRDAAGRKFDLAGLEKESAAFKLDIGQFIRYGASPRATINLTLASKAHAFLAGRGYVTPQDVKSIGMDVLRHRVIVSYEAEADEITSE